jgi:hypothetical protein
LGPEWYFLLEAQDIDIRRETEDGGDMKMLWREAIYMAGRAPADSAT